MGCGVSSTVPCATVETVPYERLKRPVDDIDGDNDWKPVVIKTEMCTNKHTST